MSSKVTAMGVIVTLSSASIVLVRPRGLFRLFSSGPRLRCSQLPIMTQRKGEVSSTA